MKRRRGMHALLGTLALIAGCSTTQRTELSGVVRDRATGRLISGARVVSADGALARTDRDGRFTLYVRPGMSGELRVTAGGHAEDRLELSAVDGADERTTSIDGESFVIHSDELPVLAWVEETWVLDEVSTEEPAATRALASDAGLGDGSIGDGATEARPAVHPPRTAAVVCADCHAERVSSGRVDATVPSPATAAPAHEGLADGCLACHAERLGPDASATCGRCHGDAGASVRARLARDVSDWTTRAQARIEREIVLGGRDLPRAGSCGGLPTSFTQVGGAFVLVDGDGIPLGDCDQDGVRDRDESWSYVEQLGEDLAADVRALTAIRTDGSEGAHDPDGFRARLGAVVH